MDLLGIPISRLKREETLEKVKQFLSEPAWHRIATVNPEFLVLAERDDVFRQALLDADLCVADGFGVVLAGWFFGEPVTRFPGADLLDEILKIADEKKLSVYLAIRKDGLSSDEEIKSVLLQKYPNLIIDGMELDIKVGHTSYVIPHTSNIVFCNFGAPDQELFLESLRNNPGSIRLAMGVGGSFDYLTGKQKRAPKILRALGLEWLWRFILQPKRFKRIWNAVVIFLLLVFLSWQKSKKRL